MNSEIYKACEEGDVNLVRIIIETSSITTDINRLEPNGSTALHVACHKGYTDIVKLLLHEYNVQRHQPDQFGFTAYEVSNDEIRKLFRRPIDQNNRFCTGTDFPDPFEIIKQDPSDWNEFYPTAAPLLTATYMKYTPGGFSIPHNGYMYHIKRFLGFDPDKKNIEKWSTHFENRFGIYLSSDPNTCSQASKCFEDYRKTRKIDHLFRLYTLHTNICKYLAQDKDLLDSFNAAINFYLPDICGRAYKGLCYRGLTMTENNFKDYRRVLERKGSFLGMKTFSSTSKTIKVAEVYSDGLPNQVHVILIINFNKTCPTAIALYRINPELPSFSQYEDEDEVLIFPGTVFSVTKIDYSASVRKVYLEYYDPTDEVEEFITDNICTKIEEFATD